MDFFAVDRQLFFFVNQSGFHNPWSDGIMLALSSHALWISVLFVAGAYLWRKGDRMQWWLLGTVLVSVAFTDSFSAFILKPWVARLRPCHELAGVVLPSGQCGGLLSFPSNHAVNAGAVTGVLAFYWRYLGWEIVFSAAGLAALVALSRVWLGVHYPGDVIAGLLFGVISGVAIGKTVSLLRTFRSSAGPN